MLLQSSVRLANRNRQNKNTETTTPRPICSNTPMDMWNTLHLSPVARKIAVSREIALLTSRAMANAAGAALTTTTAGRSITRQAAGLSNRAARGSVPKDGQPISLLLHERAPRLSEQHPDP